VLGIRLRIVTFCNFIRHLWKKGNELACIGHCLLITWPGVVLWWVDIATGRCQYGMSADKAAGSVTKGIDRRLNDGRISCCI
jgi:hypothetical protein